MWVAQAVHKDEASFIPASKFPMIQQAVLNACDASDGVKDGVLEDPTHCKFDPRRHLVQGRGWSRLPDGGASGERAQGLQPRHKSAYQGADFSGI